MTKLDFDHTDAVFSLFYNFFCLSKFSDDLPIITPPPLPDENSWIRTGTVNEYMSI